MLARPADPTQLAKVRDPAEVFLSTDATSERDMTNGGMGMMVYYNVYWNVTLGDIMKSNGARGGGAENFDERRHRGKKMDVNFCDGHAETFILDAKALSRVYLTKKN